MAKNSRDKLINGLGIAFVIFLLILSQNNLGLCLFIVGGYALGRKNDIKKWWKRDDSEKEA